MQGHHHERQPCVLSERVISGSQECMFTCSNWGATRAAAMVPVLLLNSGHGEGGRLVLQGKIGRKR
jgi:hypothetical protein